MSKWQKQLAAARNNPKDIRLDQLLIILKGAGASVREGKGSHLVAFYPGTRLSQTIPRGSPILPVYVRKVIDMIDEAEQLGVTTIDKPAEGE